MVSNILQPFLQLLLEKCSQINTCMLITLPWLQLMQQKSDNIELFCNSVHGTQSTQCKSSLKNNFYKTQISNNMKCVWAYKLRASESVAVNGRGYFPIKWEEMREDKMRSSLDELSTRGNCSGKATRRLSHLTRTPSCRQSEEEWCWAESARGKPRPRPGAGSPACSNSCSPAPTQATGKSGLLLLLWKHVCCHRCKSTALRWSLQVVCLFGQRRAKSDGHWQFFFADICKHCNPTTTSSYLSLQTGSDLSNTALHQIEFIKTFPLGMTSKIEVNFVAISSPVIATWVNTLMVHFSRKTLGRASGGHAILPRENLQIKKLPETE